MTQDQIKETLRLHGMWLLGEVGGALADLRGADLRGANLREADLRDADLREADLREADLRGADLRWADLRWADLRRANLREADLRGSNLREADLRWADLRDADLRGSNLREADLRGSNLREADLSGANLRGAAMAGSIGIIRASCSWTDHGESGRELLAVHHPAKDDQPAVTLYYCGCFSGDIERLRQYIADRDERYKASRTIAADFCEARINEVLAARAGGR